MSILPLILFRNVMHGNNDNSLDYYYFQILYRQHGLTLPRPELPMALNLESHCLEKMKVSVQKGFK